MRSAPERKNAPFSQFQSQELAQIILDGASNMIITTDPHGLVTIFNKAAEQSIGYTAQEIVGLHTPLLWHDTEEVEQRAKALSLELGQDIQPSFRVFTALPDKHGREEREWTFVTKTGKRYPVALTVTSLRGEDKNIVGYIGIIKDISKERESDAERQMAAEKLRYSEQVFRSAMENASIGMALVSPVGQWLSVNNALCALLGYTREEFLSVDFQAITHPDDLRMDMENVKKTLRGEIHTYSMEKRYFRKDGRIIWALLNVSLVRNSDGTPNYFISQIQDITERKEMDRLKAEFVSVVSHELRTPLTSIRGSLGLIAGALSKDLPDKVRHLIEIAHKNSERLILLINDILDIDKIAAGQMRLEINREFLKGLIEQAIETNRPYAEKLDVRIEAENVYPALTIDVDSARFMQILSNLLSNAAKFSPKGGIVQVYLTAVEDRIRICVRDYGAGISEEFRPRIFKKFSQADSSATREKGGTGLGLYITKEIVECMGGRIGFDTEVGKGTIFWVEFDNTSYPVTSETVMMPSGREAYRVLICDNDEKVVDILTAQIEQGGFTADTALTISEARKKLHNNAYAAMALNLAVPDESGIDFIHELRSDNRTNNLPIIITSAKADEAAGTLNGDAFGIIDWLRKPINEQQLSRAMSFLPSLRKGIPWILYVGGDSDMRKMISVTRPQQSTFINVSTLKQAQKHLAQRQFSLVILDIDMPDNHGLGLIPSMIDKDATPIPVIVLSARGASRDQQSKMIATLVQSRMSETKIVETILSLIVSYQQDLPHS